MPEKQPLRFWWQRPRGQSGWHPVWPTIGDWRHLFDDLQLEPSEIYAVIKDAVARRDVPDVNFSQVVYREAGFFSAGRAYLRVSRENHVFDICASPYGRGFFVSWHLAEARPSPIWPTLAAAFYLSLLYLFFVEHFGFGGFVLGALLFLAGFVLLGAVVAQSTGERWVQYVLVIPGLGFLIKILFLPPTYFRMDTAAMFGESVRRAVKEALETVTNAKGLRIPPDVDWKPIMRDLYRR
jgi:hypothetical protein